MQRFRPDIIHVVSPGDVSEIGVYIAKKLHLPLAISWHTNLARIRRHATGSRPGLDAGEPRKNLVQFSESQMLNMVLLFYALGDVLYAPNDELVEMLRSAPRNRCS